jgi:Putative DNA-binding domain
MIKEHLKTILRSKVLLRNEPVFPPCPFWFASPELLIQVRHAEIDALAQLLAKYPDFRTLFDSADATVSQRSACFELLARVEVVQAIDEIFIATYEPSPALTDVETDTLMRTSVLPMASQADGFQSDDSQLLARMRRPEDHLVERKTASDKKDWLKTIVAFANSTPSGLTSVLFIGVTDEGNFEERQPDFDTIQTTLSRELEKAYPPIECQSRIIQENGRRALAVIVPDSPNKPHFSGPAFVRRLHKTVAASEQEFSELIARRNSKASKILDHKGKPVTVMNSRFVGPHLAESVWPNNTIVYDCDQFAVVLATGNEAKDRQSFPLEMVMISYDHALGRLMLKLNR